ncbi:MAG: SDR family oxidoreductase [Deltaproteobacteria bacterium]|nr:SDR family oxidoreductase [Deltaproteobacteria bacterium]MBW2399616.1 SDR family oxidoreductase [Deltaproteobacteria bacterium]
MKTYVMTGATTGIGAAVREALQARGDRVVNIDIRDADIEVDLATEAGRRTAIDAVKTAHADGIDGWIPCAGLGPQFENIQTIVSLNFFHVRKLTEAFKELLAKKSGTSVLIASNSAPMPGLDEALLDAMVGENDEEKANARILELNGFQAYAGSKAALCRWMRQLAPEWAREGLRVNAVAPGTTQTPLLDAGLEDEVYGPAIRAFEVPIGHFAKPEQIAKGVLFLLGDDADFCVGSVLFVDGGSDAMIRPNGF